MRKSEASNPYQISISPRFAVLAFLSASLTCFTLGCGARKALLQQQQGQLNAESVPVNPLQQLGLPPLFVAPHKSVPHTRYTSKHYDTALSIGSDTLVSHRLHQEAIVEANTNVSFTNTSLTEEEIHEPAGQHLLIDIEHVDGAFLNSEHHLAQAMISLVNMSGLTMLSYHCHKLLPAGISCAGVLLESHVSFHTWPVQGVITLDLFTCGPNSLLNLLGGVEDLFAIPESTEENPPDPNIVWAFKRRGFPTDEGYTPGISDLGTTLLGVLQFPRKEQVSFFETPYQQVHIYNVLDPRYSNDTMERRMYLDGVLQVRQRGQAAYAEALVHPALLTHSNPKKVAIVGGGDGATLREVLKHASIEQVELVEIDQAVAEISQEWLWNQCDDFLPVSSCRDDPRVELYYQDGVEWFQERYGNPTAEEQPRQDVIILDVLNPEDNVDFSEVFYDDLSFATTLYGALAEDGILAVKLGHGPSLEDPPEQWTRAHHVATLVANLEEVGFTTIHEYEDSHGGILESETSGFLVAFKSGVSEQEWFANEALVQVKLQERLMRTKTGTLPLSYVDAATLQSYQMPSRTSEVMYCKNQQARNGGTSNCEYNLLEKEDMARDVQITMETCVNEMNVPDTSAVLMKEHLGQGVLGLVDSERQHTDVYNPFRARNAFINNCASSKSALNTHEIVNQQPQPERPSLETQVSSTADSSDEVATADAPGSCDARGPNHTEGERNAAAERPIVYDTVSVSV